MKLSICLCIRNGEKYINYINNKFNTIEKLYNNIEFEYFIYENNSTDNTKESIKNFYINRKGKYLMEDIDCSKMLSGISIIRGTKMAAIRNKLKKFHQKLDSDYVLLLDADVVFKNDTIIKLIETIKNDIVMVTPYSICYNSYNVKKKKYIHYYDSLAVISLDNISYYENDNTCLFKSCEHCINYRKNKKINIKKEFLFDDDKLIFVKSCFGSLALIKTNVYNSVSWGNTICEHHSFCNDISNYGKIVINPMIKTFTSSPTLNDYKYINNVLDKI